LYFWSKRTHKIDLFNLKFTTHVKPNRKGIVAHTAVSTGINVPLGIIFERTKDTSLSCFKRLLDFLFKKDGSTNLRNVSVHSDRGYMIPVLVFEYILACGADVVGTCKRMAVCWPFTYNQTLKENDKRTIIDVNGAPTLFLKWCREGGKHLFASAFRNGTKAVATAISSMHKAHQWEGVSLKPCEQVQYKSDPTSLIPQFFQRVEIEECEEESAVDELLMEGLFDEIEPYTLRQGTIHYSNYQDSMIDYSQYSCFSSIEKAPQIGTTFVNLASPLPRRIEHSCNQLWSTRMMHLGLLLHGTCMAVTG